MEEKLVIENILKNNFIKLEDADLNIFMEQDPFKIDHKAYNIPDEYIFNGSIYKVWDESKSFEAKPFALNCLYLFNNKICYVDAQIPMDDSGCIFIHFKTVE
jgi:hypothetical protein